MIIAEQKRKENIAEYILYMWQVEDFIRACDFDVNTLDELVISQMTNDPSMRKIVRAWYSEQIQAMKNQAIQESGHLLMLKEILVELSYLHNSLLTVFKDQRFCEIYAEAAPAIQEFQKASGKSMNEVETCLTGLYAKLIMKLQNKQMTEATEKDATHFRNVMAYLAKKYKEMKAGELPLNLN